MSREDWIGEEKNSEDWRLVEDTNKRIRNINKKIKKREDKRRGGERGEKSIENK